MTKPPLWPVLALLLLAGCAHSRVDVGAGKVSVVMWEARAAR